ncbi:hypothetical protein VCR12J2_620118 [Vibrio coralliirubri]|nr:hypothetical protein VCR12J2_620118 [Vibrio coralliirubri]
MGWQAVAWQDLRNLKYLFGAYIQSWATAINETKLVSTFERMVTT